MKIRAQVQSSRGRHEVVLRTNDVAHAIAIPPKATGFGSSANGGELLLLALATCYCNDIYREASHRGMDVVAVEVSVDGEFGTEGEPGSSFVYNAHVTAKAAEGEIKELMAHTDRVAEIQNTLRAGTPVILGSMEPTSV